MIERWQREKKNGLEKILKQIGQLLCAVNIADQTEIWSQINSI